MRKILTVLVLSLSVAGCAVLDRIENPINQNELYNVNAAYGIALSAAKGYRQSCIDKIPKVYPTCRTVVPKLQDAVRKVEGVRAAAQRFVTDNPTVSPISFIAAMKQAVADFQAVEARYSVGAK